jgi:hypothetical protein
MSLIDLNDLQRRQSALTNRTIDVGVAERRGARREHQREAATEDHLQDAFNAYNSAYQSLGTRGSPPPLAAESPFSYRRRLASGLQSHTEKWRDANLHDLSDDAMANVEPLIIAEVAATVADHTRPNDDGTLRMIKKTGDGGHGVTEFAGNPLSWMNAFMAPPKIVKRFQRPNGSPLRIQRRTVNIT